MSKKHNRNYTDYTKPQQPAPVGEEEVKVEAPVVEETVEEVVVEEEIPAEPECVYGSVAGCERLNVRKAPNASASIITTLVTDTEVMIDKDNSTDDFYKICTGAGVEGYCMKKFIKLD